MKSNTINFWLGIMGAGLCSVAASYKIVWLAVIACLMMITAILHHTIVEAYNSDKFYEYHRNVQRALDAQESQEETNRHINREIKRVDRQRNIKHGAKPSVTYQAMLKEAEGEE